MNNNTKARRKAWRDEVVRKIGNYSERAKSGKSFTRQQEALAPHFRPHRDK